MKNEQAINEMMNDIDNMVHKSLVLFFKRVDRPNENGYFSGQLDAYYRFAYYMVDDYTIQDAIDELLDDGMVYSVYTDLYHRGYCHAMHKIVDYMHRARREYEDECDEPIRHVFSCLCIDNFNC